MSNTFKRIESIDIAKGIGIILVVLGHLDTDGQISRYMIFSFHMPLFFMLSGVFENNAKDVKTSIYRAFRTLYIPYLLMLALDCAQITIANIIDGSFNISNVLTHMIKCVFGINILYYNRALWFLFALFVIKVIYTILELLKNDKIKNLAVIILSVLCTAFILLRHRFELPNYIIFISAIPGFLFYSTGYFLSNSIKSFDNDVKNTKLHLLAVPVIACVWIVGVYHNKMVDMLVYNYSDGVLYILNSFMGCYILMACCAYFANVNNAIALRVKSVLTYFGKNSIVILMFHYPITRTIIPFIYKRLGLKDYLYNFANEILMLLITLLLMVPVIWLFNRYLYFIIGKNKKEPS